jgi:3-methyladenine DNA glycosylase/8-oxoguanine DNA glycosylase
MTEPFDPAEAVVALAASDPVLGAWIEAYTTAHGPLAYAPHGMEPFPYLLRAITYQQLSGKAAATIHGRILALVGDPPRPEALLALPDAALRGAGLSRNKLAAARDLAERTLAGEIPPLDALHALSDERLVEQLTAVRGVGRWTVEMLLIFNLGRPDVLPVTDLGVRKGFAVLHGVEAVAERGELVPLEGRRRGAVRPPERVRYNMGATKAPRTPRVSPEAHATRQEPVAMSMAARKKARPMSGCPASM